MFYCPNHSTRIVESGNARFIENGHISGSGNPRIVDFEENQVGEYLSSGSQISGSQITNNPHNVPANNQPIMHKK